MSNEASTATGRTEIVGLVVAALTVVLLDQVTKALIATNLTVGERVPVIGDLVLLWYARNTGAAFSLLPGGSWLFVVAAVVAAVLLVGFHRRLVGQGLWLHLVLGLILGGALGNLVDRLRVGYVTDFISVGIGDLRWPTFNVADASLSIGIVTLVAWMLFVDGRRREARA